MYYAELRSIFALLSFIFLYCYVVLTTLICWWIKICIKWCTKLVSCAIPIIFYQNGFSIDINLILLSAETEWSWYITAKCDTTYNNTHVCRWRGKRRGSATGGRVRVSSLPQTKAHSHGFLAEPTRPTRGSFRQQPVRRRTRTQGSCCQPQPHRNTGTPAVYFPSFSPFSYTWQCVFFALSLFGNLWILF